MPVAPVGEKAVLYYEDSGAPAGSSDYVTIVLVHGLSFHGAIYRRMFPLAAKHNMRFVAVNMRDYPGSTPYTPQEIADLANTDPGVQARALRTHAEELAKFVEYYIKENSIPLLQESGGKRTGGLALMSWSMGNILAFAFLGFAATYTQETRDFLGQYLRTVVLFDPANSGLGRPAPAGVYHPLRDTSLSLHERGEAFVPWVSYYFETISSLEDVTLNQLSVRRGIHERSLAADDLTKVPTVYRMTKEELDSVLDRDVFERSSRFIFTIARDVLAANVERALVDTGGVWPAVQILQLWADESMHDCIWAAKTLAEIAATSRPNGRKMVRERMSGANHFPQWDMPELVVDILSRRV